MIHIRRVNEMSLALLVCLAVGLSACGKKQDKSDVRADGDDYKVSPANGELSKSLYELQSNEWAEACDRQAAPKANELVTIFDRRADEISKFAVQLPPSKYTETVPFGDSVLKRYINLPEAKKGWQSGEEAWAKAYDDYLQIKDQPMNRNWVYVNSAVRSLIVNDRMRIIVGMNMDLRHDSGPFVLSLAEKLKVCEKDKNCVLPEFSSDEKIEIERYEYYTDYVKRISNAASLSDKRKFLVKFIQRAEADGTYYAFRKNPSITVARNLVNQKNTLTLPIEGSSFSDVQQKQLNGYIENIWNNDEIEIKVDWRNEWLSSIFKLFFEVDKPGSRAYVSFFKREMHLFPLTDIRSISHEIGHVIGFPDRYYTRWDAKNCQYIVEYSGEDLMSDSSTGVVTEGDWQQLKKQFIAPEAQAAN